MPKKAQVATFIIIGIIILAAVAVVIYVRNLVASQPTAAGAQQAAGVPAVVQPVQTYVQNCLQQTASAAVVEIGKHGGYINPVPLPSITYQGIDVSTWVYLAQNYSPSLQAIQSELGSYVILNIDGCIAGIEPQLAQQGFNVTKGTITPNVTIADNNVLFKMNYPITLSRAGTTNTISDFAAAVPVRLGVVYAAAQNLTAEQIRAANLLCISCMTRQAVSKNILVNITYYGDLNIIKLTDQNPEINKNKYEFNYAVKLTPPNPT